MLDAKFASTGSRSVLPVMTSLHFGKSLPTIRAENIGEEHRAGADDPDQSISEYARPTRPRGAGDRPPSGRADEAYSMIRLVKASSAAMGSAFVVAIDGRVWTRCARS